MSEETVGLIAVGSLSGDNASVVTYMTDAKPTRPQSRLRWLMLFLGVCILLGPYFAFDNPTGTQIAMRQYFGSPSYINENSTLAQNASFAAFNQDYELLFTFYSVPNTVLPLFAGALVDKIGVRPMTIITTSVSLAGQLLVTAGIAFKSWPLAWFGRAVFGIGTESMCVAQRTLVSYWFVGGELAVAMGAILAFGRLGSVISDNVSAVFDAPRVAAAYGVGAALCLLSLFAALVAGMVDAKWERQLSGWHRRNKRDRKGREQRLLSDAHGAAVGMDADGMMSIQHAGEHGRGTIGGFQEHSAVNFTEAARDADAGGRHGKVSRANSFIELPSRGASVDDSRRAALLLHEFGSTQHAPEPLTWRRRIRELCPDFKQMRTFELGYVGLCLISVAGFAPITTFNGLCPALLKQRWESLGLEAVPQTVNATVGILYAVAAATAPFMGALVDKLGYHAAFLAGSQAGIFACHVSLSLILGVKEGILLGVMGLCFATFASAFWTSISLFVPVAALGLAFGLMGSVQNAGLALAPLLVAALQPPACSNSFMCVETLLAAFAATAALVALALLALHIHKRRVAARQEAKAAAVHCVADAPGSPLLSAAGQG